MDYYFADTECYSVKYFKDHKEIKPYALLLKSLDKSIVHFDVDAKRWLKDLFTILPGKKSRIYIHNGGDYDVHFFWRYIYELKDEGVISKIEYFMNKKHTVFNLKIYQNKKEISFCDSAKLFPLKLAEIGELIGLPKFEIDDYDITTEFKNISDYLMYNHGNDYKYLERDVDILVAFFKEITESKLFKMEDFKNTIASSALAFNRKISPSAQKHIHNKNMKMTKDDWLVFKRAYFGGFTYLMKKYQLQEVESFSYDINSLYPSVMEDETMPYGQVYPWDQKGATFKLFKVILKYGKANYVPFIPIDGVYQWEFKNKTIYISNYLYETMKKYYTLEIEEEQVLYSIKERKGIFNDFITHFKKMKIDADRDGNKVIRKSSKLYQNSRYGKEGENIIDYQSYITTDSSLFKINENGDKVVIWYQQDNVLNQEKSLVRKIGDNLFIYKVNNGYIDEYNFKAIPVAIKIASISRIRLVEAIVKNIDTFIYCDTDSIHLTAPAKGIEIDKEKYGAWKYEGFNDLSIYRRTKHYLHINTKENTYVLKGGGFNVAKFNKTREITPEQYKKKNPGIIKKGKMFKTFVKGGVLLWEDDYQFTDPEEERINEEN